MFLYSILLERRRNRRVNDEKGRKGSREYVRENRIILVDWFGKIREGGIKVGLTRRLE